MKKRAERGTTRASPRVVRWVPSRSSNATETMQTGPGQAGQAGSNNSDGVNELPEAAPDVSEIKFENDVAQIPIASLTLDVPLIPFIRDKRKIVAPPFKFLELPSELRVKIYEYYFSDVDYILDLDPTNYKRYHKLLGFMRLNRQIHNEATWLFYNTHSFRIFPVHPARLKVKKTILTRLKSVQRDCLSTLDLRFGPGFNAPPRSWIMNEALGLKECVNVTQLNVFVECDPSDGIFKGFRRSEGFYETFSRQLLAQVLEALPSVRVIEFDAWSSVKKNGGMMRGLLEVVLDAKLQIQWGPERGWTDDMNEDDNTNAPPPNFLPLEPHNAPAYNPNNIMVMLGA